MPEIFKLKDFKGWILDWDGLLAHSPLDFSKIYQRFFDGRRDVDLLHPQGLDQDQQQEMKALIELEEDRACGLATQAQGALRWIQLLNSQSMPWCVVTRNRRSSLELASQSSGIGLPSVVLTRETPPFKPDEQAFYRACDLMKLKPSQVMAVGDYVYELLAARRAGIRCALVGSSTTGVELADCRFKDLDEMANAYEQGVDFVSWEYRKCSPRSTQELRLSFLDRAHWLKLEDAAAAGICRVWVPNETVTEAHWRNAIGLSSRWIGRPLPEAVRRWIGRRWPMVEVNVDESC